jgi:hypothetical protein
MVHEPCYSPHVLGVNVDIVAWVSLGRPLHFVPVAAVALDRMRYLLSGDDRGFLFYCLQLSPILSERLTSGYLGSSNYC